MEADSDAVIESVSAGGDRFLGFMPAELIGMSMTDIVHPDHLPQLHLFAPAMFDGPRTIPACVICRDGSIAPAEIIRYPRESERDSMRIDVMTWN